MGLSADEIQVPLERLNGHMFKVESKMRPGMDMQMIVDVGPVLTKRGAEQANGAKNLVGLVGPFLSSPMRGRRRSVLLPRDDSASACTDELL